MRRRWLITLLVCLFLLGEGAVVIFLPQVVHYNRSSEVYKKYCQTDGVDATFIKDYQVNDTLTLSVTILKANDSTGWALLKKDFAIPAPTPRQVAQMAQGRDLVTTKMLSESDVATFSYLMHSVSVFHVKNREEGRAVLFHNLQDNINKCKTNLL